MHAPPTSSPIAWNVWIKAVILLVLLGAGKFGLRWEQPEHVRWALVPAVSLVEALLHVPFSWVAGQGYRNADLRILVDHSCAGSGFFLMSVVLCFWHFPWKGRLRQWSKLAGMLVLAGVTTMVVTGLRLAATIFLVGAHPWFDLHRSQVHTWIGVAFYFCSLVVVHLFARKFLSPEPS
ncbi:MAG: exosortase K [Fibrobacteres bacterium]|nr:exosortase K [Fibrobacterota bacterium]